MSWRLDLYVTNVSANGELAAFREQWRADINERRRGRRSVNADEHGPPAGESSVRLQRPERTQQHQKQVCNDSAAVLDHDEPAEPGTSHQDDSHPEKALDVWEAGLQHEQQGKLSDALMCYRRALKVKAFLALLLISDGRKCGEYVSANVLSTWQGPTSVSTSRSRGE